MYYFKMWAKSMLSLLLVIIATGCDDNDAPQEVKLTVATETLTVGPDGGAFNVEYVLEGAAEGERPQIKCDEAWINGFNLDIKGVISFSVDANEQESPRRAIVDVLYGESKSSFSVIQDAAEHIESFTIDIKEIYDAGVVYSIVPADAGITYVSMVVEKSYFDSYDSDDAYFADDLKFFKESAEASQMQLSEYLASILKKGETSGPAYRLKPEHTYYIYAYGLTSDGERLTEICKHEFTTAAVERSNVKLNISYTVTGTSVTMTVTPDDPEQLYMFNAIEATPETDDKFLLGIVQNEIDQYIEFYERLFGVPQDEAVKRFASKGVSSYTFDGLKPETNYVGYAVAVNRLGSICADVVSAGFTTEAEQKPEDEIKISVSSLSDREITVDVESGIADHYVIGVDNSVRWEGMTDEQILQRLIAGYQWQAKGGEGNGSYTFYSLMPQTGYSIFAFGYVDGVATTRLYRLDFTTKDAVGADILFKMEYDRYFDGTEMAATYGEEKFGEARGKAVLPVRLVTEGTDNCAEIYYLFFEGDYSDRSTYPDDVFMDDLIEYGDWRSSNCYYPEYDKPYTMIGFGATDNMAMGPLSRQVVTLSRAGASPVSEYSAASVKNIYKGKQKRNAELMISLSGRSSLSADRGVNNSEVKRVMPYITNTDVPRMHRFVIK